MASHIEESIVIKDTGNKYDKKMNTVEDFNEVVKQANLSSERVLWIKAKTQSGMYKSFTIDLEDSPKNTDKTPAK